MNFASMPLCGRTQNTIYFMGSLYGLNKWIHVKHIHISHMVRIRYFFTEQVTFPKSCSYFTVESGFICILSNFKVQTLFSLSPDNAWLISKPIVQTRISRGAQSWENSLQVEVVRENFIKEVGSEAGPKDEWNFEKWRGEQQAY